MCTFLCINVSACVSRLMCVGHRITLGVGPCPSPCLMRDLCCFPQLGSGNLRGIPVSTSRLLLGRMGLQTPFCMSSFDTGARDLNSGSQACMASTFTHRTISSAPQFILNLADASVKATSRTIREFSKGWKCISPYQEFSQRTLEI